MTHEESKALILAREAEKAALGSEPETAAWLDLKKLQPGGMAYATQVKVNHRQTELIDRSHYDALQLRLNASEAQCAELLSASKEMLRIAGLANQGSNAYNRAIIHLHDVVGKSAPATNAGGEV